MTRQKQAGFTIVELMIALTILSVILLLSTLTLSQLGKLFSKGVNQANTQNIARNLMTSISSDIQVGSNMPQHKSVSGSETVCMGATRYTFLRAQPLDATHPHVLWRDSMKTADVCTPFDLTAYADLNTAPDAVDKSGVELLGNNMEVTDLDTGKLDDRTWFVTVTIAYGGDLVVYNKIADTTNCQSVKGNQFCAVASLKKTVTRRLAN
ncbi:MAG: hypothetical protein JWO41_38 [Candidatus Saccharibacteria bacterium]|nr:hypothetical protein [Candidatus Saccharibacteria bacterium]